MRPNEYDDLLKKIRCSDDFRSRMQEKLSAEPSEDAEYEEIVSGEAEVITPGRRWGKFAALAAAFVIIGGAAGGTAYHFSKVNSDNVITDKDGNKFVDDGSIYAALRSEKDDYCMLVGAAHGTENAAKLVLCNSASEFFDYMDTYGDNEEIRKDSAVLGSECIYFRFGRMDQGKDFSYQLLDLTMDQSAEYICQVYNNGTYVWSDMSASRVTYHRLKNGEEGFDDLRAMLMKYTIDWAVNSPDANEGLRSLLDEKFNHIDSDYAYYMSGSYDGPVEYKIVNFNTLKADLLKFDWVYPGFVPMTDAVYMLSALNGSEGNYETSCLYISRNGIIRIENGDIMRTCFALENDSDVEAFREMLDEHFILNQYGTDVQDYIIRDAFNENYDGKTAKFRKDSGQFTGDTDVTVSDFEGLKNELASLEWVTCEVSDENIYKDFYIAGAIISRNGYIYPQSGDTHQCAYRLKFDSSLNRFREILDAHFTENSEETTIYSKLKVDKESYTVDLSDDIKKNDIDKNRLFEYLDNYDMSSEIGPGEFSPSDKKITVFFRKIGEAKKEYSYVGANEKYAYKLVIYDTGAFTWTENNNGKENLTMHSFADDGKVYQDILDMFAE
ncbi:hypothetical protein [Ruminococcus flavefaciens]|uniref:hypothetical protein n=1 Tax=Ruminococcus flavefaciens TaxID=1265 RepID=UPI0004904245|nr:hypothetical protein [Ruminococcus flavefaciens]